LTVASDLHSSNPLSVRLKLDRRRQPQTASVGGGRRISTAMVRCAYAIGSLVLIAAFVAVGIAFFGPFWLANVSIDEQPANSSYFLYPFASGSSPSVNGGGWIYVRGLWAECGVQCQWFWEDGYALQKNLFSPLSKPQSI
jgi:hypothetical protein